MMMMMMMMDFLDLLDFRKYRREAFSRVYPITPDFKPT
jgi:hypothetical protein